jgi:hypothetical protein
MSETKESCEICKFFEPTDGRFGKCHNQSISQNTKYGPCAGWPDKVRRGFFCGLFEPKADKNN